MSSGSEVTAAFRELSGNEPGTFLDVSELLLKYVNNVIRQPDVTKYRSIRLGNKMFENRVLPVQGALECLFTVGFEEDDENITLKESSPLDGLRIFQRLLAQERLVLISNQINNLIFVQATEQTFSQKLQNSSEHVMKYEDPLLQQKAREKIPFQDLKTKAEQRLRRISSASSDDDEGILPDFRDCLLLELMKWFKERFFRWMNSPNCSSCGGRTRAVGNLPPTTEDLRWGAGQVEGYTCPRCNTMERFPRYNNPEKLLETRTGRCGEWANCFTLCCRALNFEARHVLDWTDHVWTEVYSNSQKRWLHMDPCENCCDKPLLYEHGWNKKLSYIIAFSFEEVVDVTWRYTAKEQEVIGRRKECREKWLMESIAKLNQRRQANQTGARRRELEERFGHELVEFLSPKTIRDGEDQGRLSGSAAWRVARGESGAGGLSESSQTKFVFRPTESEKREKLIHVRYNTARDRYIRISDGNRETEDWEKCVFSSICMFRKQEFDWQMVYLARQENTDRGWISWKFDTSGSGMVVDKVKVRASSKTYENAQVKWTLEGDGSSTSLNGSDSIVEVTDLAGSIHLELKAELSGGSMWQHTQLFRQEDGANNEYPLDISIYLKEG
ncbi:peptide-N(4)-(N-acetyl-beta-glucosaminyl)asparagine amidase-like isoform X1 [Lytechinus variegatus]|uniref:peptide-N(4)-(N-acetyl-beta- glucosaminyl)asparagine amidase-like isoform X1 n=1 Tax=Lytechinus variegatus TaxID=7654 RepID=UPI001BB2B7E6|nr:peptide-N(4)-(N-acetyl-beta-glucosaminyl)asparagine amidase-like isoform X1 [Lytechinus variegatus]